ncbi:hypothetical protein SCHPADRAFT_118115 [Schizopora paradoxa]|uniref:Uncharacterized protein n=1 Tax=Schizopora paradoxa TaxID=27342 RepID=A0A0H2S9S8_9AGAM|nr:hypothetical protein SCHPADRAFT_118115 [Schizopora paradoxa]
MSYKANCKGDLDTPELKVRDGLDIRQRSTSKSVIEPRYYRPRDTLIQRLKVIGSFADASAKLDVESVAKKIEKIRRHGETTIFERHAESSISLSDAEIAKLKSYCNKLVELSSSGRKSERYASEEIVRLSIEDPRVHLLLKERQLFPSSSYDRRTKYCCTYAFFTVDDASLELHGLWSGLFRIARETSIGATLDDEKLANYLKRNYTSISSYMRRYELSFLGARYLRNALQLPLVGNSLYYLVKIWHVYLDVAQSDAGSQDDESAMEWSNLDACFQSLPTGVLRTAFATPTRLANLYAQLMLFGKVTEVPSVFRRFYAIPDVCYESLQDGPGRHTSTQKGLEDVGFRLLPLYRASLLDALNLASDYSFEDILKKIPENIRRLKGISLKNWFLWKEYCDCAKIIWDYHYRRSMTELNLPLLSFDLWFPNDAALNSEQRALATFLVSILISDWPGIDANVSANTVENVRHLIGTLNLPLFDNVPYLRRYCIGGRIYITSDNLPEPPSILIKDAMNNILNDFTLDTLTLKGNEASYQWLFIDEHHTPFNAKQRPFNWLNYIPVSPEDATDEKQTSSYVAAVKIGPKYHFTCVQDGASSVKYSDELGDEYESHEFLVLAERNLQNNRDDVPDVIIARWRRFWPVKDPEYLAASESAKVDDAHLESLLNGFLRENIEEVWDGL